jgi:hypothetical protein
MALADLLQSVDAFAPAVSSSRPILLSCATACEIDSVFANDDASLTNVPNGANAIRSGVVTNYRGDTVRLGDVISKDSPHVVIYLRHMG